jgi:hypothetical protein
VQFNATRFSLFLDAGMADLLGALDSRMVVSKSALADESVISTRLRNRRSVVFQLRLSGISASFELI